MANNSTINNDAQNFVNAVSKASESTRKTIAQQLKDANFYKGKVTGEFNVGFYSALTAFGAKFSDEQKFAVQFNQPKISITDYLAKLGAEGSSSGSGGGDGNAGPTTTRQTYVTSASQTAKLLDTVAQDLLERKLTSAEKAKYLKLINAEQKSKPSINVRGKGYSNTTGGVDEQQFITDKIAATDEAKTVRATDAYAIMMQELGGLR
jgi:hypothetical protein